MASLSVRKECRQSNEPRRVFVEAVPRDFGGKVENLEADRNPADQKREAEKAGRVYLSAAAERWPTWEAIQI